MLRTPLITLATCGWVLGPPSLRTLFDERLPKSVALSCINREVGKAPVDPGFARIEGRSLWAIPWMEDDPALTSPQLWAGRMRRDAADALRYGCDGLLGIHWRTRVLSANVLALARAAWKRGTPTREDAEVLYHGIAYDVLPSGLSRRCAQQVILIHNRKGVEAWHTHHLDYLPDTQQLEVRVARVIRPDGSELEATRSDVSLGDPAVRLYYDRRLLVIRFRGLRPGDALEIQTLLSDIPAGTR